MDDSVGSAVRDGHGPAAAEGVVGSRRAPLLVAFGVVLGFVASRLIGRGDSYRLELLRLLVARDYSGAEREARRDVAAWSRDEAVVEAMARAAEDRDGGNLWRMLQHAEVAGPAWHSAVLSMLGEEADLLDGGLAYFVVETIRRNRSRVRPEVLDALRVELVRYVRNRGGGDNDEAVLPTCVEILGRDLAGSKESLTDVQWDWLQQRAPGK